MACFSGGGPGHGPSDAQQMALLQHAANRVRAEMRVPERRLYWVKLRALVGNQDWVALEKFSKERRPPIGEKVVVLGSIMILLFGFVSP